MIPTIKRTAEGRMQKSIEALEAAFNKIRTGRAHPNLLNAVKVSYYGTETLLSQVASINVEDARTLAVVPWEKSLVSVIEKAILTADLGLNPATSGATIRVPLPALTEETRKELIKVARAEAEHARVAVRNIRRDANEEVKKLLKEKSISTDDERRAQEDIQKLTDKYVAEVDKVLAKKEHDLLEV